MSPHEPVLLREVVDALDVKPSGIYVDATFGRGGHARAIAAQLGADGRLLLVDRDPDAIDAAQRMFQGDDRVRIVKSTFSSLQQVFRAAFGDRQAAGIVIDLGVSSPQLDESQRGFSFSQDGPLDMRMDPSRGESAGEWLASVSQAELVRVLRTLGEERYAVRIAKAIVRCREEGALATTAQLARVVSDAVPTREPGKHPATRTFLAIRMRVNRELEEVRDVLPQCVGLLAAGGRLAVISFHSIEDREVKRFMRAASSGDVFPAKLPVRQAELAPSLKLIGRPLRPSSEEVVANPRARSAILRVAERL